LPGPTRKNAQSARDESPVAPPWHTAALIFLILFVAATGTLLGRRGSAAPLPSMPSSARIVALYFPMLLMQWGLMAYVGYVGRPDRARNRVVRLLGKYWDSFQRAVIDLALAVVTGTLIIAIEILWAHRFGQARNASVASLLPATFAERIIWAIVAVSVGFCEEVVYRGYLQIQLAAFTRSAALAIAMQATLFGIAHGDQGATAVLRFALYGLVLGGLAKARASLWPGIICHIGIDLMAGLIAG
jgi:membrane protease YdiL (CAAX protease family)